MAGSLLGQRLQHSMDVAAKVLALCSARSQPRRSTRSMSISDRASSLCDYSPEQRAAGSQLER